MKPLISVIVPVYKVEKYLLRCVESIRRQTYDKIEIILVNDGSPDRCPQICEDFAKMDTRIKVIHKENGGLSDARNVGINNSKGEYICFVDSDDCISDTMLEHLSNAIRQSGAKMALTNFKCVNENNDRVFSLNESQISDGVFSAQELLLKLYQKMGWYYIVSWNKLYHRSLFDEISFPVGKIHEDEYIVAQLFWRAGNIACISSEEYIYTYLRKGSIMSSRQTQAQCDWLEALFLRFNFCKDIVELEEFAKETRAVYFRELNNLFLQDKYNNVTVQQKRSAKAQYQCMEGKKRTEKLNWILFKISPKLENKIVRAIRNIKL